MIRKQPPSAPPRTKRSMSPWGRRMHVRMKRIAEAQVAAMERRFGLRPGAKPWRGKTGSDTGNQ